MKRCWLHIGMHKTGSSSVQKNLAAIGHTEQWRYMKIGGRPNMGPALHAMFEQDVLKCRLFAKTGDSEEQITANGAKWREQLRQEILSQKEEICIISAEALSSFSKPAVIALRDFLAPLFDEIRVIGYVRPPIGFKTSRFQENLKQGATKFNPASIRLRYRARFRKFDEVFGRKKVILRKFDPSTFPGKCLVADFCQHTGIRLPDGHVITRANESLCTEACGLLFAFRKFGPPFGVGPDVIQVNLRLVRALMAMQGRKFKVAKSVLAPALKHEAKDIDWMEKRLGVSLEEAVNDDSGITGEDDLLTISKAACEEFAALFSESVKPLPPEVIPQNDPADPKDVSAMLETGRNLCRQILRRRRRRWMQHSRSFRGQLMRRMKKVPSVMSRFFARVLGGETAR